jgi:acyl carrier protein
MESEAASNDLICQVLAENARLAVDVSDLREDADLYDHGMTSHASVNVMLGLEEAFDVEFPDELLRKETFASIQSITAALSELGVVANPSPSGPRS